MKVWIIRDFEPLPTDSGERRLMRSGMLSMGLAEAGHLTTWFTASFDHYLKKQRPAEGSVEVSPNLMLTVLKTPGYRKNISVARILYNRAFAAAFLAAAQDAPELPDVIVTDIPSTEMARTATMFGRQHRIPTVLSIRDLWPDFFLDFLPPAARIFAKPFIRPLDLQAKYACSNATSLVGISDAYLKWGQVKGKRLRTDLDRVFPLGYSSQPEESAETSEQRLRELGVPQGQRLVSFVGSWGNTYDVALVCAAAEQLAGRTDITFVIAGDADSRPDLRDRFAGLPNVVLPGWLSARDIAILLRASEIGLAPYHADAPQGLPNKIFEYMAYGAYQFATLTGEVEQVYRDTGAGEVIAANPQVLAAAIEGRLAESGHFNRNAIIQAFEHRFDANKLYKQMREHIENVVYNATNGKRG